MDNLLESLNTQGSDSLKGCCTKFYENDLIAFVLGENFHPGGEKLTLHLGELLDLNKDSTVLDVACGAGISAVTMAKYYGCNVVGIDLSEKNLEKAKARAERTGLTEKVTFKKSDAEKIEFKNKSFDAVTCECALCTFPDIKTAVSEMFRVLKTGGKVGITDIVIEREIPEEYKNIISFVACIAGAQSTQGYKKLLREGGFRNVQTEQHNYAIAEIFNKIKKVIKGWELVEKLCNCDLEKSFGLTPTKANEYLKKGFEEMEKGTFGYGLFIGDR
jgi:ubiquinone/menaquinone biosynthesis C-methylase UbiE